MIRVGGGCAISPPPNQLFRDSLMFRRLFPRRRKAPAATARRAGLQTLESRRLLAATPLGATWKDTGEYLLGTVAVTTVLLESNGAIDPETQNWETAEIQPMIDEVVEGVTWWSDLLAKQNSRHTLDFVFDHSFAVQPFETSYEPIDRPSGDQQKYVGEFLAAQGYAGESSIENAMWRFNHAQRERLDANWSFTIFVVDASDDPDGQFPAGGFPAAFALPGGLHMVVPSVRQASTVAHEMGHIFWAFDEYSGGASYDANRGYYDSQNLNAWEGRNDVNPTPPPQQDSIMRGGVPLRDAFVDVTTAAATLELVGWRDSDGDGVFDVLDVPLDLDAVGYFDASTSQYHLAGTAAAVALHNRNSYGEHPSVIGSNADITLNRISEIQYRLDNGPWQTALSPDQQLVDFEITVSIEQPFTEIQWRAIDAKTQITSAILEGSSTVPAIPESSHRGFAFIDGNGNGDRDLGEQVLFNATITIEHADGSPLLRGSVDAADFDGALPDLDGVTLTVEAPASVTGPLLDSRLRSLVSQAAGGQRVFHAQELENGGSTLGATRDRWAKREFVAEFDSPVGEVRLDVIGLDEMTYGRLEAYDSSGRLLSRTTELIDQGQLVSLVVSDTAASIASVRAFGIVHSDTGIAISRLEYGFTDTATTDRAGAWQVPNLPDGDYVARITPPRVIHAFDQPSVDLQIRQGTSSIVVAAATRVDSPRHNSTLPHDANQDGNVTAADALVIINDLARHSARILSPGETSGFDVDVNNDGAATALDALWVINHLGRVSPPAEAESLAFRPALALDSTPTDLTLPADHVDSAIAGVGSVFAEAVKDGRIGSLEGSTPTTGQLIDLSRWGDSDDRGGRDESTVREKDDTKTRPATMDGGSQETEFFSVFAEKSALASSEIDLESAPNTGKLTPTIRPIRSKMLEPLDRGMI